MKQTKRNYLILLGNFIYVALGLLAPIITMIGLVFLLAAKQIDFVLTMTGFVICILWLVTARINSEWYASWYLGILDRILPKENVQ